MSASISVKGLKKSFLQTRRKPGLRAALTSFVRPDRHVVDAVRGVTFDVEEGEAVAFIGPNGAGKSTTIKMLTGILHPTSGEASVLGFVPWKDRKKLAYQIGSVFGQKSQLWLHLPPQDTFELLGRIYELEDSFYEKRKNELI